MGERRERGEESLRSDQQRERQRERETERERERRESG